MTKDELKVLNYVDARLGGPESIIGPLRPTFLDLIERGLIETVTRYRLTSVGRDVLVDAEGETTSSTT